MKKLFSYFLSLLVFSLSIIPMLNPVVAFADTDTPHQFSLKVTDFDPRTDNWKGSGTKAVIPNNSPVEAGQVIQVDLQYKPGSTPERGMQVFLNYNPNQLEAVYRNNGLYTKFSKKTMANGGMWPEEYEGDEDADTNWSEQHNDVLVNGNPTGQLSFIFSTTDETRLTKTGTLISVFFIVKDGLPGGTIINLAYDNALTKINRPQGEPPRIVTTTGASFYIENTAEVDLSLATLTVKNGSQSYDLSPAFVPGSTDPKEFTVVVPNQITSVNIAATANGAPASAIVSTLGNKDLDVGDNEISIMTQHEEGDHETYTVTVHRLSNENRLSNLSLTNSDINIGTFNEDTKTYSATVDYAVKNTTVNATLKDSTVSSIESGTGSWALSVGSNTKKVIVTPESCDSEYSSVPGNTCTKGEYTITVTRGNPSQNTNLSDLTINGTTITGFQPDKTEYTLSDVDSSVESITVNATVQDTGKATIDASQLGTKTLNTGDNQIKFTVQSEDPTVSQEYTINIKKLSGVNTLSSITMTPKDGEGTVLTGGTWSKTIGAPGTYTYTAPLTTTTVDIAATPTSPATIASGVPQTGVNIETGGPITIMVTAEDGTPGEYIINLERAKSKNANLTSLSIGDYDLYRYGTTTTGFDSAIQKYSATVAGNVGSVIVTAAASDAGRATVKIGTGASEQELPSTGKEVSLSVGVNTIIVTCYAEDTSVYKTYEIEVTRERKTVSSLKSLTIDGELIPGFDPDVISYTIPSATEKYPKTKNDIVIGAEVADDSDATIREGDLGTKTLDPGTNTYYVKVTAQNGTSSTTYTITAKKIEDDVSTLSELKIAGTRVTDFEPNSATPKSFGYEVENEINSFVTKVEDVTASSLLLEATATSRFASIDITNTTGFSTSGETVVSILVTAQDGTFTDYKIHVTKKPNENNKLSGLTTDKGALKETFSADKTNYTKDVDRDTTSITIIPTKGDVTQNYTITGPETLELGENTFTVKVLSEKEQGELNQEELGTVYTIVVTRKKSDDCLLTDLTVNDETITGFTSANGTYTLIVDGDTDSIKVGATLSDPLKASLTINGGEMPEGGKNIPLTTGENTITIVVTAEDPEVTKTYTITVTKPQGSTGKLSNLAIVQTSISPSFDSDTTSYTASVDYEVSSIEITATGKNGSTVSGDVGTQTLTTGANTFTIIATSEDGSNQTPYTVVVTRKGNNNALLSNITLSDGKTINETFDPDDTSYTASIENSYSTITIIPHKQDPNATVTISGETVPAEGKAISLNTGDNVIELYVTAEDGETHKTYTVTITRAESSDTRLREFEIEAVNSMYNETDSKILEPEFASETREYNITVPYEWNKLHLIKAIPNYEDANVSCSALDSDNNISLESANEGEGVQKTVTFTVTAENGDIGTYTFNITKEKYVDNFLKYLKVTTPAKLDIIDENGNPVYKQIYTQGLASSITFLNIKYETSDGATADFILPNSTKLSENKSSFDDFVEVAETNIFKIVVKKTEGGKVYSRTYTLDIHRDELNTNNTHIYNAAIFKNCEGIDSIDTCDAIHGFDSFTESSYVYNVDYDVTSTLFVVGVDSKTSVTVNDLTPIKTYYDSGTEYYLRYSQAVDLNPGTNTIYVKIIASSGYSYTKTVVINRGHATGLSNLTVSPGTLTPAFSPDTTEYTVEVGNTTTSIDIAATASEGTITGDVGTKPLNVGPNTFTVTFTPTEGVEKNYEIVVTRKRSDVKDLSTLTIDGDEITGFNKDTTEYTIDVANNVTSVEVGAAVLDSTSSIVSGTGTKTLNTGENTVVVTVQAEDGSIKEYTVTINRAKSDNNYLANLEIEEGDYTPVFNKTTKKYFVTVPNEVTEVTINAPAEDENASVEITGNTGLSVGENTATITVTAENETENTYEVVITRQPYADNHLTNIEVIANDGVKYNLSPEFSPTTLKYTVAIPNTITSVNINVTKQNDEETVTGDGTVGITGLPQTQKVIVTKDGVARTYKLIFVQGESGNNKLTNLSVSPGTLTPAFNSDTEEYKVSLPEGTTKVNVSATKGEDAQTITGLGEHTVKTGPNTITVTVTAANGSIKTYTINAKVESSDPAYDNVLDSLSVNPGTLTPEFDPTVRLYTVDLEESQDKITVSATGENTVTGTGEHNLVVGANVIEVKSIDSENNEKVYRIVVNRGAVVSPYLAYLAIDEHNLNETFAKETFGYTADINKSVTSLNVIAVPEDKNATVTITGNTGMTTGENTITIVVTDETTATQTYTITVTITGEEEHKITSSIHTVDTTYVRTAFTSDMNASGTVKTQFDNPAEQLKIYNTAGVEIADTAFVGNGYTIKLIINGVEYDSKIIIVKGDINSNGIIDIDDMGAVNDVLLEDRTFNTIETLAGDINGNNIVDIDDMSKINDHLLEDTNLFTGGAF